MAYAKSFGFSLEGREWNGQIMEPRCRIIEIVKCFLFCQNSSEVQIYEWHMQNLSVFSRVCEDYKLSRIFVNETDKLWNLDAEL